MWVLFMNLDGLCHDIYISIFSLSASAASTLNELKTQTRAGLEYAVGNRKVKLVSLHSFLALMYLCSS